mgnify:CR=1 FL=1
MVAGAPARASHGCGDHAALLLLGGHVNPALLADQFAVGLLPADLTQGEFGPITPQQTADRYPNCFPYGKESRWPVPIHQPVPPSPSGRLPGEPPLPRVRWPLLPSPPRRCLPARPPLPAHLPAAPAPAVGEALTNTEALANPEALEELRDRSELR